MSRFKAISRFNKSVIGAFIGFFLFAGVSFVSAEFYYRFMPGNWFIDYYYVKVDDTTVGSDVQATLCRRVRGTNLRINATRTFLMKQENGVYVPVGDYEFRAGIEKLQDTNCQPVRIAAKDHPKTPGTYKFHTEADYVIKGKHKSFTYDSNVYVISAEGAPKIVEPSANQDAQTTKPLTP